MLIENQSLIRELDKFRNDRNFVADKAILRCLDPVDGGFVESQIEEVQTMLNRAHELSKQVLEESRQFLGHYYGEEEKA